MTFTRFAFLVVFLISFSTSSAVGDLVSCHSFEGDASRSSGFHLGVNPADLFSSGSWGSGAPTGRGVVVDPSLARTGDVAMVIDQGERAAGSSGGGGIWAVYNYSPGAGSFGSNYTFDVSAYVAENPNDLVTGGNANLHFEFYDANGTIIFRTDTFGLASFFQTGNDNGDSTPDYSLVSHSFTLSSAIGQNTHPNSAAGGAPITAATLATIATVRPSFGSWNGGNTPGDGQFLIDDFKFTTSVPEPTGLLGFGFASVCLMIRRKRFVS